MSLMEQPAYYEVELENRDIVRRYMGVTWSDIQLSPVEQEAERLRWLRAGLNDPTPISRIIEDIIPTIKQKDIQPAKPTYQQYPQRQNYSNSRGSYY